MQFQLSADKLLLSTKPLEVLTKESVEEIALPDLYPIKHTVTLVPENIYELRNIYRKSLRVYNLKFEHFYRGTQQLSEIWKNAACFLDVVFFCGPFSLFF